MLKMIILSTLLFSTSSFAESYLELEISCGYKTNELVYPSMKGVEPLHDDKIYFVQRIVPTSEVINIEPGTLYGELLNSFSTELYDSFTTDYVNLNKFNKCSLKVSKNIENSKTSITKSIINDNQLKELIQKEYETLYKIFSPLKNVKEIDSIDYIKEEIYFLDDVNYKTMVEFKTPKTDTYSMQTREAYVSSLNGFKKLIRYQLNKVK